MATRNYRLVYPPALVRSPMVHQLIKSYDLEVNILQAQITLDEGWLELEVSGDDQEIERAIAWLSSEGLEVITLK